MNLSTVLLNDSATEGCVWAPNATRDEVENLEELNEHIPGFCVDTRTASVTASDTVANQVLYQNWLRSMLGQSEEVKFQERDGEPVLDANGYPVVTESNTAYKYGQALFAAQAFSWSENDRAEQSPQNRTDLIAEKAAEWRKLVTQIEQEDPEAFAHITGERAWERTGTGLLALLTAIFFALFDMTASILIILGFMIVRFAIVALPIIGTIALLRPAGGPFKRLVNTVLGAVINVAIFSLAAVIYIWASSRILGTTLPVWLQVILIGMLGIAAWLLLRPASRIKGLVAGGGPADALLGRRTGEAEREAERERDRERVARRRDDARPEEVADSVRTPRGSDTLPEQKTGAGQPAGAGGPSGTSASGGGGGSGGGEVYRPSRKE
jgi:uncharacterized membrane protein YgcG